MFGFESTALPTAQNWLPVINKSPTAADQTHSAQESRDFETRIFELQNKYLADVPTDKIVKIAVLDSGLTNDGLDPLLNKAYADGRIQTVNFLNRSGSTDDKAVGGHGTHVVRLLLRFAPHAMIHVGKITESKSLAYTPEGVLIKALKWASQKADIVVLPVALTIPTSEDESILQRKIRNMVESKKLIFAAAGNSGESGERGYPARLPGVFAVYSTDRFGNPDYDFNPPLSSADDNIGAYGNGIQSFWNGSHVSIRGSSYAAPTTAALVANILEFARRETPDVAKKLQEYDSMRDLIRDHLTTYSDNQPLQLLNPFIQGFWDGTSDTGDIRLKLMTLCPRDELT